MLTQKTVKTKSMTEVALVPKMMMKLIVPMTQIPMTHRRKNRKMSVKRIKMLLQPQRQKKGAKRNLKMMKMI